MGNDEVPKHLMTNDEIPKDEVPNDEFGNSGHAELGQRAGQYNQKIYDLEERTARFGEMIIDFAKLVPLGPLTNRLIDQLIGAGTSVGANYCEADDAVSKKDFRHRISFCKKEARESKFFIRMIVRAVPELREMAKPVWQEAKELHLIFAKIYRGP